MRRAYIAVLALALAVPAIAAPPQFTYSRTVTWATTPSRIEVAGGDSNGHVYFTNNGTDRIFCLTNPSATGSDTPVVVWDATGDPYGPCSWQGISASPSGAVVYASGRSANATGAKTIIMKITPNFTATPPTFTKAFVTGVPDSFEGSGCTALDDGRFAIADYSTGAIKVFSVSGTAATEQFTVTGPGAVTNAHYTQTTYDPTNNKLFVCRLTWGATNGTVFQFNTDAGVTQAGTQLAANNPLAAGVTSVVGTGDDIVSYQSAAVQPDFKVIAVNTNINGDTNSGTGPNSWKVYSYADGAANQTAIRTIDLADAGRAAIAGTQAAGSAFFKKNGNTYLIVGTYTTNGYVYQVTPAAAVQDWSMY